VNVGDSPSVSVIIPFHGAEPDLRECLGSLQGQSSEDFEVIIVADGIPVTRDVGEELRASGRSFRIVQNATRSGPYESRRRGATFAKGQYLSFVDHDDLIAPNFIAAMLATAQEKGAEVVECPILAISEAGMQEIRQRFALGALHGHDILTAYLHFRSFNNLVNKLIHRRIWFAAQDSIGSVDDEPLTYFEDLLCTAFIYSHATSYYAIDETHYVYKWRRDSTMNTPDPAKVAQSIRSLTKAVSKLDPLLSRYAQSATVGAFLDREVSWAVKLLETKLSNPIDPELEALLNSLRMRYCRQSQLPTNPSHGTSLKRRLQRLGIRLLARLS